MRHRQKQVTVAVDLRGKLWIPCMTEQEKELLSCGTLQDCQTSVIKAIYT